MVYQQIFADSKYHDYYIWKRGGTRAPTTGKAGFIILVRSEDNTDTYYLHIFSKAAGFKLG